MAVLMTAQTLGWITFAQASETAATAPAPAAAPPNSVPALRRALREFDRFLDHHPLLEDQLRLDPQLATSAAYLEKHPELRDLLQANPNITEGLKLYPRYFLYRALMRQASAPVSFSRLAPFKDLFQAHPGLEQALTQNPESVCNPVFLKSHPALLDFLNANPALARVFLPPSVPAEPN
jgi:hypothetical protein